MTHLKPFYSIIHLEKEKKFKKPLPESLQPWKPVKV
jgi:hypothetical protein